jgi:hypothetical protein
MNHTIWFAARLGADKPTVPLAELLLSKMQVVQINEKDIKDTIVLLREHDIGERDEETVNVADIAQRLSGDWGFYYTFMTNLDKVENYAQLYGRNIEELRESDVGAVKERIAGIKSTVKAEGKSIVWKLRSKIGTKKKWYKDVEEIDD